MEQAPPLHTSIVSLVSLAAGIAAKHPDMGLCQVGRLRELGVPEAHIQSVVEIARHIRDEAAQKLDHAFDEQSAAAESKSLPVAVKVEAAGGCCTPTPGGQSCC